MKKFLKLFFFLCSLIFVGCSSTYTVSDFPSKEKLYQYFNDAGKDKSVKIILTNDSSFNVNGGIIIKNDSLYEKIYTPERGKIALSEIKNIEYLNDYKSKLLIMNNGMILKVENIKKAADSIEFINVSTETLKSIIHINKVRELSYEGRSLGILSGILFGVPVGFIAAISKVLPIYDYGGVAGNIKSYDEFKAIVIGTLSGAIIGGVVGWLVGNKYTYQLNP